MLKIPMHTVVKDNKEVGLGDVIRSITNALNIKLDNCGCDAKQKRLNELVVFVGKKEQ